MRQVLEGSLPVEKPVLPEVNSHEVDLAYVVCSNVAPLSDRSDPAAAELHVLGCLECLQVLAEGMYMRKRKN